MKRLLLVVVLAGFGCDAGSNPNASLGPSSGAAPVDGGARCDTFTHIYYDIITLAGSPVNCMPCHTVGMSGGLSMATRAVAYMNLINRASTSPGCSGLGRTRVIPGDSAHSLLWNKVSGVDLCGPRMPFMRPPFLSQADVDSIAAWIDAGALDN